MKKIIFILLFLIIGLGVAVWLNPELLSWLRQTTGTESVTKVYKWQDEDGSWHVTDNPPPPGVKYQEQEYLRDTNVLPALTPAKEQEEK